MWLWPLPFMYKLKRIVAEDTSLPFCLPNLNCRPSSLGRVRPHILCNSKLLPTSACLLQDRLSVSWILRVKPVKSIVHTWPYVPDKKERLAWCFFPSECPEEILLLQTVSNFSLSVGSEFFLWLFSPKQVHFYFKCRGDRGNAVWTIDIFNLWSWNFSVKEVAWWSSETDH